MTLSLIPLFATLLLHGPALPIAQEPLLFDDAPPPIAEIQSPAATQRGDLQLAQQGGPPSDDKTKSAKAPKKSPFPDLGGHWAQLQVTSAVSKIPVVGKVYSTTTSVVRWEIKQNGANLAIKQQVCDVKITSTSSQISTIIPKRFIKALGTERQEALILPKDNGKRFVFLRKQHVGLRGVKLKRPAKDAMPDDEDDARFYDQDKDGNPGMTVQIRGLVDGDIYIAQRGKSTMRGEFTDKNTTRIDGRISWQTEQVVLGASSVLLKNGPNSRPNSDRSKSYFRTTKLSKEFSCAAIVKGKSSLFKR